MENYSSMRVFQLKYRLKERGMSVEGNHDELCERLRAADARSTDSVFSPSTGASDLDTLRERARARAEARNSGDTSPQAVPLPALPPPSKAREQHHVRSVPVPEREPEPHSKPTPEPEPEPEPEPVPESEQEPEPEPEPEPKPQPDGVVKSFCEGDFKDEDVDSDITEGDLAWLDVADLALIPEPSDLSVLRTLRNRFAAQRHCTYVGNVLVMIGPLNHNGNMHQYRGKVLGEMPPHPVAIAEEARRFLIATGGNQHIVLCGSHGSGKSEAALAIIGYLCDSSPRAPYVAAANSVLSAFGHAAVSTSPTSSRCGRVSQLHYNRAGTSIQSCEFAPILLESQRVAAPAGVRDGENMHIFYQLCCTPDECKFLMGPEHYRCLHSPDTQVYAKQHDSDFGVTRRAMQMLGISRDEQAAIFGALAAVLLLGNVNFVEQGGQHATASVANPDELRQFAELLHLEVDECTRALCTRSIATGTASPKCRSTSLTAHLGCERACQQRDRMMRSIYEDCYWWIIGCVNKRLCAAAVPDGATITVIDSLGVEIPSATRHSGFHQLCSQYASERFRRVYDDNVIYTERSWCSADDILRIHPAVEHNGECLDLLEGQHGIFAAIHHAHETPKAYAGTLIEKLCDLQKINGCIKVRDRRTCAEFSIRHSIGTVVYYTDSLLESSWDVRADGFAKVLKSSTNLAMANIFGQTGPRQSHNTRHTGRSVCKTFIRSIQDLASQLDYSQTHYVRCLVPSTDRDGASQRFHAATVLTQLRSLGVIETAKLRCHGHTYSLSTLEFVSLYGVLSLFTDGNRQPAEILRAVAPATRSGIRGWHVGDRVWMDGVVLAALERRLCELKFSRAVEVQSFYRMRREQAGFDLARTSATKIQAAYRGISSRKMTGPDSLRPLPLTDSRLPDATSQKSPKVVAGPDDSDLAGLLSFLPAEQAVPCRSDSSEDFGMDIPAGIPAVGAEQDCCVVQSPPVVGNATRIATSTVRTTTLTDDLHNREPHLQAGCPSEAISSMQPPAAASDNVAQIDVPIQKVPAASGTNSVARGVVASQDRTTTLHDRHESSVLIQASWRRLKDQRRYRLGQAATDIQAGLCSSDGAFVRQVLERTRWSAQFGLRDQLSQLQAHYGIVIGNLRSRLTALQNLAGIDELEAALAGSWELKDDIGDVWGSANEFLTTLRVEKDGVYGHLLKRMLDLSVSEDIVKLAAVISEFDQLLAQDERLASRYIRRVRNELGVQLEHAIKLAQKVVQVESDVAGYDLEKVSVAVEKHKRAHEALQAAFGRTLGEEFEMLEARQHAIVDRAREHIACAAASDDLREVHAVQEKYRIFAQLKPELDQLAEYRSQLLMENKRKWRRIAQGEDVTTLAQAIQVCSLHRDEALDELFAMRRRLEVLSHDARERLQSLVGETDPREVDAALDKYKEYPRSTQSAWRRLRAHRSALPTWWKMEVPNIPQEIGPLYRATTALEYLGLTQQKQDLELRLQKLIRQIGADIKIAVELSDPVLMEQLLRHTRGCDHLFDSALQKLHSQYTAMLAQAKIDIAELLACSEPSSLHDIEDALAGYGGNQMDAISADLAALRAHRDRIVNAARVALRRALSDGRDKENGEASTVLRYICETLACYNAVSREPEWVALRDYCDHLIIEGRERLTNLLKSNDLVLIGHAVRDYKGVPEVEDLWTPLELHFEALSDVYLTQAPHHKRKPSAVSPGSARIPVDEIDHVIEERLVSRLHEQVSERKAAEHRYREEEVKRKQLEMQVSQLAQLAHRHEPTLPKPDLLSPVAGEEAGSEPRSRCPVCGAYVLASEARSHAESCAKQLLGTRDGSF